MVVLIGCVSTSRNYPDLCYNYGMMGHISKSCSLPNKNIGMGDSTDVKPKYGPCKNNLYPLWTLEERVEEMIQIISFCMHHFLLWDNLIFLASEIFQNPLTLTH